MDAGDGDDVINGGAGNDTLRGSGGADTLSGQAGADLFHYQALSDSTGGAYDTIKGFEHLADKIDLAGIDANALLGGNQMFKFIEDDAFTGSGASSAGQLRAVNVGGNIWQVQGDVNGDGVADLFLQVEMADLMPLTASDFLL